MASITYELFASSDVLQPDQFDTLWYISKFRIHHILNGNRSKFDPFTSIDDKTIITISCATCHHTMAIIFNAMINFNNPGFTRTFKKKYLRLRRALTCLLHHHGPVTPVFIIWFVIITGSTNHNLVKPIAPSSSKILLNNCFNIPLSFFICKYSAGSDAKIVKKNYS